MDGTLGEMRIFAGNYAPRSWADCDGHLLAVSEYSALFSLLGTLYGGDGRTTFGLPDLRGRAPVSAGRGPGLTDIPQGVLGGTEGEYLNEHTMAAHGHDVQSELGGHMLAANLEGEDASPSGNSVARPSGGDIYSDEDATTAMNDATVTLAGDVVVHPAGANNSHSNRDPYMGIRYIMCLDGVFPDRP